jgi:hypothetical protein
MKKIIFCFVICFAFVLNSHAQSFITAYMPGYQVAGFHGQNVQYNNVQRGDIHGKINNFIFKGDGIANHFVCGMDVSLVLNSLIHGFKASGSYYGAAFDVRMGYAPSLGDNLKLGIGIDAGARGIQYDKDSILMDGYSYYVFGGTLVGLYNIGDAIYIMPKLSFDPIFTDKTDSPVDGMSTKFEISAGLKFGGALGFSITPGFEKIKFNYEDHDEIKESFIKTKYLQFGFSFMFE